MLCRFFIIVSSFIYCFILSISVQAEVRTVIPQEKGGKLLSSEANIYFLGAMSVEQIIELGTTLDGINIDYGELTGINLYIHSHGGDLDSGLIGYRMIKSSKIPVRTINLSRVESSATLLFCGGEKRHALQGSKFVFHAPSVSIDQQYLQADAIERRTQNLENFKDAMKDIYSGCFDLSERDISEILSAEYFLRQIKAKEAKEIGLITEVVDALRLPAGSAYIYEK